MGRRGGGRGGREESCGQGQGEVSEVGQRRRGRGREGRRHWRRRGRGYMWERLLSYLFRDILDADGPVGLLGPGRKSAGAWEGGRTGNEEGQSGHGGGGCRQKGDKGRGEGEAGHFGWERWLRWRSGGGETGQQWLVGRVRQKGQRSADE